MNQALPARADATTDGGIGDCTALKVRRLARKVTQIYDDALAPYGVTVGQLGLLAALRRSRGVGVGLLAQRLSSDASTISRLLKPLEAAGLINILPDPDDRRAKSILLTDAGAEKRRAAVTGWHAAQARVAESLGAGRLATLRFILDDATQHL